jgi:hypothetical protein
MGKENIKKQTKFYTVKYLNIQYKVNRTVVTKTSTTTIHGKSERKVTLRRTWTNGT